MAACNNGWDLGRRPIPAGPAQSTYTTDVIYAHARVGHETSNNADRHGWRLRYRPGCSTRVSHYECTDVTVTVEIHGRACTIEDSYLATQGLA